MSASPEKPIKYELDGTNSFDLLKLTSVHDRKKSFECDICESNFITTQSLKAHIASAHDKGEFFHCDTCKSTFPTIKGLCAHTKSVHEKKKPHKCAICKSNFATCKALNAHIAKIHKKSVDNNLKILAVNVENLESKHLQIQNLLMKYQCSIAVLSETETTHEKAATAHMQGFKAFCPPSSVTRPPGKEAGVLMLVSNTLATSAKPRPDINGDDTVQTVWTEFKDLKLIVGGIYRRCRPGISHLERAELDQLAAQVLKANSTGFKVLLIGDINMDHTNKSHRRAIEADEFL